MIRHHPFGFRPTKRIRFGQTQRFEHPRLGNWCVLTNPRPHVMRRNSTAYRRIRLQKLLKRHRAGRLYVHDRCTCDVGHEQQGENSRTIKPICFMLALHRTQCSLAITIRRQIIALSASVEKHEDHQRRLYKVVDDSNEIDPGFDRDQHAGDVGRERYDGDRVQLPLLPHDSFGGRC